VKEVDNLVTIFLLSGISGENATNFGTECPFPESFEEQSPVIGQNVRKFLFSIFTWYSCVFKIV
jgi:hypothetical protein